MQPLTIAILAGLAHYLDAWGHAERVASAAVKRAPSVPPFSVLIMLLLLTLVLACGLPGCSVFGPGGALWPVVSNCAPSGRQLIAQVESILLAGGDIDSKLQAAAKDLGTDGLSLIVCAVETAVENLGSKLGASESSAAARGHAFLAKTGNAK